MKTNNNSLNFILGLSTLLVFTDKLENALFIGVYLIVILLFGNTLLWLLRKIIKPSFKLVIYLLIGAIFVTGLDYITYTYLKDMYELVGMVLPILVLTYTIVSSDDYIINNSFLNSLKYSLKVGFIFMFLISFIAIIREILGTGMITIIASLSNVIGYRLVYNIIPNLDILPIKLISEPFGALLIFGILVAVYKSLFKKESDEDVIN